MCLTIRRNLHVYVLYDLDKSATKSRNAFNEMLDI